MLDAKIIQIIEEKFGKPKAILSIAHLGNGPEQKNEESYSRGSTTRKEIGQIFICMKILHIKFQACGWSL